MTNNKDLKDWTFDELVSHCAWMVTENLLQSKQPLYRIMYQVCELSARWNKESNK